MTFRVKATGFGDFEKNMRKIIISVNSSQAGIAEAMLKAVEQTVIPVAKSYAYSNFDSTGNLPESIVAKKVNQYQVDIEVLAPHGAIHEFGGTFEVTDKQRAFFWHKFMETDDEKWKALALSDTYTMPARPYIQPALDQELDEAMLLTAGYLYGYWKAAVGNMPTPKATTQKITRFSVSSGFCP